MDNKITHWTSPRCSVPRFLRCAHIAIIVLMPVTMRGNKSIACSFVLSIFSVVWSLVAVKDGLQGTSSATTLEQLWSPPILLNQMGVETTAGRKVVAKAGHIMRTAEKAVALVATCTEENATSVKGSAEHFSNAKLATGAEFDFVREVSLTVQAIDGQGNPQNRGGDYFILTFIGWMSSGMDTVAYKTATAAKDLFNGSYIFEFRVSATRVAYYNLTLLHYHTCYQGYGPSSPNVFTDLDFQPKGVSHVELSEFLTESDGAQSFHEYPYDQLPIRGESRWPAGQYMTSVFN